MEWSEDLSVGVRKIDEQHKELFLRINGLVEAIKQHTCKYAIGDVVKFLEDYILFHFGEEEKYMQEHHYPGYTAHKAQHERFIRSFGELKEELPKLEGGSKPGSYDLSVQTNQVVVDWILEHISRVDKEFGKYLQDRDSNK
ncbi:MAG TPA: bacteriohemerythrin [Dissulfurispiraceae bacterium]